MKVVLFCGGLGTRLRDFHEDVPKPMVRIGLRPILWHVMKYYAHFGHREFILCLGYRPEAIKNYFINYQEHVSNDFTLSEGGHKIEIERSDIHDWKISFVDTGLKTSIGQRLRAVKRYIGEDEYFLANYSDGLTDLDLNGMIARLQQAGKVGSFLCARPSQSFHVVTLKDDGSVTSIKPVRQTGLLINAGYFVFHRSIFDYIGDGVDLVGAPFERLIEEGQLLGQRCDNFWCMDTFKEQQELSDLWQAGEAPWELWKR